MIDCTHPTVQSYQNINVVTPLTGFQKEIEHIFLSLLLSKAGTKPDNKRVSGALLNDFLKASVSYL